jgi:saccharopine dehydrogenase (NAD+, L-lysine forming)
MLSDIYFFQYLNHNFINFENSLKFKMNKRIRIGILKETKIPPDRRVPFSPGQLRDLKDHFPHAVFCIQPGAIRCFADHEYSDLGIDMTDDLSDCDILLGIKEILPDTLIHGKTYLFFSHTGKMQPHNRKLLQEIRERKITLIDYEYLTDTKNNRLVAFGKWAGIVGAYNGLRAYGERYRLFLLKPAYQCFNIREMKDEIQKVVLPSVKILVTGGGRVANGAIEILGELHIKEIKPEEFLREDFNEPVLCRIDPWHYVRRKDNSEFSMDHFITHPDQYESIFKPYTKVTDVFLACHYWDPASPVFMKTTDIREPDFRIKVIADISCDVKGPIPSTIRSSTIENPFYGYYPLTESETPPFDPASITVMAVDNLPGELPRDASEYFGEMLMNQILPHLFEGDRYGIIDRATIMRQGILTERFKYLQDYLEGKL